MRKLKDTLPYLGASSNRLTLQTFFSTNVVKYQSNGTAFSSLALMRWLQVTLPLTALTFLAAWSTYRSNEISRKGVTTGKCLKSMLGTANAHPVAPSAKVVVEEDHDIAKNMLQRIARSLATT
jgi:hypothetical protein